MAWTIQTEVARKLKETAYRKELGDDSYEDRIHVAKERAGELKWQETQFYGPQFENMALAASDRIWPAMREKNGLFWRTLFGRMAGK